MQRSSWYFIVAIILIPVLAFGIVSWYEGTFKKLPFYGPDKHVVSDFNLINQHGQHVTISRAAGKIIVADFFFTSCPSICPTMTKNLKEVQERFKDDGRLQIFSFTVDPERDDVVKLKAYATLFGVSSNWDLLTGDKKELYRQARKSYLLVATDGDGGVNDFIHSDKLVLIDADKKIRGFYDGTNTRDIQLLISDIKKLKKES